MFCGTETVDVSLGFASGNIKAKPREHRQSRVHKTYCFPEVSVNKYLIIYQESKKRKNKANFIRKYMKYFINFLKTFAVFGCPKVACSRDGAHDFFVIHR